MSYTDNPDFRRIPTTNARINAIRLQLRANEKLTPNHTFDEWFTQCRKVLSTQGDGKDDADRTIWGRLVEMESTCNAILEQSISAALFAKQTATRPKEENTLVTMVADLAYWSECARTNGYTDLPQAPDVGAASNIERRVNTAIGEAVTPLRASGFIVNACLRALPP